MHSTCYHPASLPPLCVYSRIHPPVDNFLSRSLSQLCTIPLGVACHFPHVSSDTLVRRCILSLFLSPIASTGVAPRWHICPAISGILHDCRCPSFFLLRHIGCSSPCPIPGCSILGMVATLPLRFRVHVLFHSILSHFLPSVFHNPGIFWPLVCQSTFCTQYTSIAPL